MKKIIVTLALLLATSPVLASEYKNLSADAALQKLQQGNERFVKFNLKHPNQTKARRLELVKGQHPFVTVLSCSDSRVPTELIFDQGLGDIFVIRNAGNVLDEHVIGSIEYSVEHLGVNLIVVMGHESCGAVGAAMSDEKQPEAIESLIESIEPAVEKCKHSNTLTYENVIKTHAKLGVEEILKDKDLCEFVQKHNVKIVPAYYSLKTGKVEFLK